MTTVRVFSGCAVRSGAIDQAGCTDIARVPVRNKQHCAESKCKSPWRLCIACVSQGAFPQGVVDTSVESRLRDGLCAFHAANGAKAIKQRDPSPKARVPVQPTGRLYDLRAEPVASGGEVQPASTAAARSAAGNGAAEPAGGEVPDGPWKDILDRVKQALAASTFEASVDPSKIRPLRGQPRTVFNPVRLQRLRASMLESGQIQPITLRRIPRDEEGHEYELVDGERRWRAATEGLPIIMLRAMVVTIDDEAAQYVIAVLSNFNREEHTPLETCDAIVKMHEGLMMPMNAIAKMFGKSELWVNQRYGLRRLVPEVREMLDPELPEQEQLSIVAAIRISQKTPETQLRTARQVMRGEMHVNQIRADALERGEAVNVYQRTPAHQIELLASNAVAVRRLVDKLKSTLDSTDATTLDAATPARRQALRAHLGVVSETIHEVRTTLATAFNEEQPAPPPAVQPRPTERVPMPVKAPMPAFVSALPPSDLDRGFITIDYYERAGTDRRLVKGRRVSVVEYGAYRNNGALAWQVDGGEEPRNEVDFRSRMGIRFR